MEKKHQLIKQQSPIVINEIDTDYKAEVVAAGLIENGYDERKVCILRLGNATRGFSKDVEYIRSDGFTRNNIRFIGIWTNRPGMYDILPEGMFHSAKKISYRNNKREMLAKIKQIEEEEAIAREFFKPLEISINNALINAQLYERKLEKKYTNRNFIDIFKRIWPTLDLLPLDKAILLVEIMPLLSRRNFNLKDISLIYTEIMDIPVQIQKGRLLYFCVDKTTLSGLGKTRLGINTIIGNKFTNGYHDVVIKMGPMTEKQLLFYRATPQGKEIARFLKSLLFLASQEVRLKYIPIPGTSRFRLSKDKTKSSRLGINTYL